MEFAGDGGDYNKLYSVAERAGRLLASTKNLGSLSLLRGWRFSTSSELWWALVFEIAWSKRHPLLTAERRLWLPEKTPTKFVPYDIDQLRGLAQTGFGPFRDVPSNWLKRLPDAFVSDIENAAVASFDVADYLLSEFAPAQVPAGASGEASETPDSPSEVEMKRRFAVALSFPGRHRELVAQVAEALSGALGQGRVFYDKYHESELPGPNLDLRLQSLYRDEADLIVAFVCGAYQESDWCSLEWRAIRDLVKNRAREDVMYLRLDDKPVDGLMSIDGYLDVAEKPAREIADVILRRWSAKR